MEKRKVLYISQEMQPYMSSENEIAHISRNLPQGMLEQGGYDIRTFMPRFGSINERRHQLHEVIRLSGMNIIINDTDQPLIIKVASIPSARMQVYFIDNEEYFQRKHALVDQEGQFFNDNDERAIFFVRGVFETVKKLGWSPDIIHCHGWMASLVSVFMRTAYKHDPVFMNAKVVMSLYNTDQFSGELHTEFAKKVVFGDMKSEDYQIAVPTYVNVMNAGIAYADAVVQGAEEVDPAITAYIADNDVKHVRFNPQEDMVGPIATLYEELMEESVLAN